MNSDHSEGSWGDGNNAGACVGYSKDWVEARALPWQEQPVKGRIRFKKPKGARAKQYFKPDIYAFLTVNPV